MAGRFAYWMNVSLDLFIERETGEHGYVDKVHSHGPNRRCGAGFHPDARSRTLPTRIGPNPADTCEMRARPIRCP